MKQILTIAFMLAVSGAFAQDTTGVTITLKQIVYYDGPVSKLNIAKIENIKRRDRDTKRHKFYVGANEVLELRLYDNKLGAMRSISTIFVDDNDRGYFEVVSDDNLLHSPYGYGPLIVEVSEPNFTALPHAAEYVMKKQEDTINEELDKFEQAIE